MPDGNSVLPSCQATNYTPSDDGTMCLSASQTPTPVGHDSVVELFSIERGFSRSGWCGGSDSALVRSLTKKWQCDDDVRGEIASVARRYKESLRWREDIDKVVKCSKFVDDVLTEVFRGSLGHHLAPPPRIGGYRGKLAHAMETHKETPWLSELGTFIRSGRSNPPTAGDWADVSTEIPMWQVVEQGPNAAQPGDILAQAIPYSDASGHVGIVVGPGMVASADSTASPPGKITIGDFGFRPETDERKYGHSKDCIVRRFTCPEPSL